jgi:hypothetical protein
VILKIYDEQNRERIAPAMYRMDQRPDFLKFEWKADGFRMDVGKEFYEAFHRVRTESSKWPDYNNPLSAEP